MAHVQRTEWGRDSLRAPGNKTMSRLGPWTPSSLEERLDRMECVLRPLREEVKLPLEERERTVNLWINLPISGPKRGFESEVVGKPISRHLLGCALYARSPAMLKTENESEDPQNMA